MDRSVTTLRAAYRFDRFTLDVARGALLVADGTELPLRPKSWALLRHLVEHAGFVVGRNDLLAAVWPGLHVTDDSVAQCIKDIRRVLGDEGQHLLRTVPRRGYLLAASASRVEPASAACLSVSPLHAFKAQPDPAVPAPPAGRPMVVVLPFEDLGGGTGREYLADGLTCDLVTNLTRYQVLYVAAPPHGALRPSAAPGRALHAATYVVGGGVQRDGSRVRVTAFLDDARTGVRLWADRFDRVLGDIFAVQDELATGIAAHLVAQVAQEDLRQARRLPPESVAAYEPCLHGHELRDRAMEADTLAAGEMFARATAIDPF